MSKKLLKRLGLGLLLIPLIISLIIMPNSYYMIKNLETSSELPYYVLGFFAFFILLLIAFIAYKKPGIGGILLIIVSLGLAVLFFVSMDQESIFGPFFYFLAMTILFVPPLISGILLVLSSKK
jgi:peptidoglycan/LPS O-acetylase OafA/YrhL